MTRSLAAEAGSGDTLERLDSAICLRDVALPIRTRLDPHIRCQQAIAAIAEAGGAEIAIVHNLERNLYVHRQALRSADPKEPIASLTQPINASELATANLELTSTLRRLHRQPLLFVLDKQAVTAVASPAAIHNPVVGLLCFSLILLAEHGLNRIIREFYGSAWWDALNTTQQDKIEEVMEARRTAGAPISPLECMMLAERLTLVARHEGIRSALALGSRTKAEKRFTDIKRLRDVLAHGGSLRDTRAKPQEALALFDDLVNLRDSIRAYCSALEP